MLKGATAIAAALDIAKYTVDYTRHLTRKFKRTNRGRTFHTAIKMLGNACASNIVGNYVVSQSSMVSQTDVESWNSTASHTEDEQVRTVLTAILKRIVTGKVLGEEFLPKLAEWMVEE